MTYDSKTEKTMSYQLFRGVFPFVNYSVEFRLQLNLMIRFTERACEVTLLPPEPAAVFEVAITISSRKVNQRNTKREKKSAKNKHKEMQK